MSLFCPANRDVESKPEGKKVNEIIDRYEESQHGRNAVQYQIGSNAAGVDRGIFLELMVMGSFNC